MADEKCATVTPEYVTITRKSWEYLRNRDAELTLLEIGGVDNWEGYDLAFEEVDEDAD